MKCVRCTSWMEAYEFVEWEKVVENSSGFSWCSILCVFNSCILWRPVSFSFCFNQIYIVSSLYYIYYGDIILTYTFCVLLVYIIHACKFINGKRWIKYFWSFYATSLLLYSYTISTLKTHHIRDSTYKEWYGLFSIPTFRYTHLYVYDVQHA
jgi:hypothetical protein